MRSEKRDRKEVKGKKAGMKGKKERKGGERGSWMDGWRVGSADNLYNTQQYSVAQASSLITAQRLRLPSLFIFPLSSYLSFILEIKRMKEVRRTNPLTQSSPSVCLSV